MEDEYVRQTALAILRNPHRRFVLAHLNGQAGPLSTQQLAQSIIDWETDGSKTTPNGQDVEEVAIRLHHEHLPALTEAGVIDYDWEQHEVTEWRHPNLGEEWLTSFPIEDLSSTVRGV